MSCPNAIEIKDEHGYRFAITGPFLQEYDIESPNHRILADRVVLLYQIGRALAARKKTIKIDCLYTQCSVFAAKQYGNNVSIECFRIAVTGRNDLWIGCKHFTGVNAAFIIEAARKAWKEIKK